MKTKPADDGRLTRGAETDQGSTETKNTHATPPPGPATWWTPQGFILLQDAPPAFQTAQGAPAGSYWDKALADAGYTDAGCAPLTASENNFSCGPKIKIYNHGAEDHLYVEVCGEYRSLSNFLVAEQHQDVFFATWYVEFARSVAQIEQAQQIAAIAKTLVAFVRHGVDTIDEYGTTSYDDDVKREARLARRAAR